MGLTVKRRGHNVATFRFIEVRLMEILSGTRNLMLCEPNIKSIRSVSHRDVSS